MSQSISTVIKIFSNYQFKSIAILPVKVKIMCNFWPSWEINKTYYLYWKRGYLSNRKFSLGMLLDSVSILTLLKNQLRGTECKKALLKRNPFFLRIDGITNIVKPLFENRTDASPSKYLILILYYRILHFIPIHTYPLCTRVIKQQLKYSRTRIV